MPKNINAATRVKDLLLKVQSQPNKNVGELWAESAKGGQRNQQRGGSSRIAAKGRVFKILCQ